MPELTIGACVFVGSVGVTGTVTGLNDKGTSKGVSVRLHRQVNGVQTCYATHAECSVIERSTETAQKSS